MKKVTAVFLIILLSFSVVFGYVYIKNRADKLLYPVKYKELVTKYSEEYLIPDYIIYSVIKCESSFEQDAVSVMGAIGLMQITPDTFEWLCKKTGEDFSADKLYDPETNIKYGTYFLSMLYKEFGDWDTAHAAYNAGRSRVKSWLKDF